MSSLSDAITIHRVSVLIIFVAILSVVVGVFTGIFIGRKMEDIRVKDAVAIYAQNSYNACKQQQNAVNGYNTNKSWRDCQYLKQQSYE